MKIIEAELIYPIRSIVGEGSFWDVDNQSLLWVDILAHKLYLYNPKTRSNTGFDIGKDVGTVVLTESGWWAFADEDGIGYLNPKTGEIKDGPKPEIGHRKIRFNDGKCDPRGNFWAGTMAYDCVEGAGKLYEFDSKGDVNKKIEGCTISNGLVWNRDSTKFFFIDSPTYQIHQFNYDINTGEISSKKIVARIPKEFGLPDGMSIDSEDHLWVALFDGGKVVRIDPDHGEIVYEVLLPVPKITSCAFGGEYLNELYITTASYMMSGRALEKYPLSGSLFKAKVPFKGVVPNKMKAFL